MLTLGKMLSLATPQGAIMGNDWLLWIFRSLENGFSPTVHLKMLSDIGVITHPNLKVYALLCKYLYILFY